MEKKNVLKRGIVKIKPIFFGILPYRYAYGSVCSSDVVGTPPVSPPTEEELEKATSDMISRFKNRFGKSDFVELEKPLIIKEHKDFRKLPPELSYDVDGLLVDTVDMAGAIPLELNTLSRYGLPIITGTTSNEFLRALRVKKFLKQSKFIYIGEIPSFSAPNGAHNFFSIEERLGISVRHIETNEFYRYFDRFSEAEVKEELRNWRKMFDKVLEPSVQELMNATRVYLTFRYLCEREDANGLTVNCGRFTEERPVTPCLAFARLIDEGIICACEGDITAMLSSLMIHAVSGQPMLMGNFGSRPGLYEAKEEEVTIEHDIIPLSMAKSKYIIRDFHGRKFGVTGYADIKENQPMTILNMDKSLAKINVIEGNIKGSEDGIHCRVVIHMSVDGDINRIPEIIVGDQHVSMAFGHWLAALKETGKLLGFEVEQIV